MTNHRWMMAVAAVLVALVAYGYFTWPKPPTGGPEPPTARLEDGVLAVGYREYGEDDWDLIPAAEAHQRAQEELGFAFALPDLPLKELALTRVDILSAPTTEPRPAGQYYTGNMTYVRAPLIDSAGRVRLPKGSRVPAPDDQNVRTHLSVEYPVSSLDVPPGTEVVPSDSVPEVAVIEGVHDATYLWLIGDVRYRLMCLRALRDCPRGEMLRIVESTAPSAQ